MRDIRVATAQFENRDNDKEYNLGRIRELTRIAEIQSGDLSMDRRALIQRHRATRPSAAVEATCRPGDQYVVFDLLGCKVGISICYDNNLPENVRINAMMGAEVIFMPHVTGCLPSIMPGRGTVSRELWDNRFSDPVSLRQEFRGPKGRDWLMRWLPTRAWENGIYAVFSNPIGWDYDTVKPGLAMILDPFGEVLAESHSLGDEVIVGFLSADKLNAAPGQRYRKARRPELYKKIVEPQQSVTMPGWSMERK